MKLTHTYLLVSSIFFLVGSVGYPHGFLSVQSSFQPPLKPLLNCDFQNGAPQVAPGAPGIDNHWAPARKDAIGTTYEASPPTKSPLWFTLSEGVLSEIFYPYVDQAQVGDLQFIITDGSSFFSEQRKDTVSKVDFLNEGMTVRVQGKDRTGTYEFEQFYVTDTESPTLRIKTKFRFNKPGLKVFILFNPALNNGRENIGFASSNGLFATHINPMRRGGTVSAALIPSVNIVRSSSGYVGCSDGWQDLSKNYKLTRFWPQAGPGNIALTAQLDTSNATDWFEYELTLSFGTSLPEAQTLAETAQFQSFQDTQNRYESSWKSYLKKTEGSRLGGQPFFAKNADARRSALIIKMHEDKTFKGAMVASMTKPGIPGYERAPVENKGGYHLVWPRDLYHAALALLAAGDIETPIDTLKYLMISQRPDGSWPQNYWLDAIPYWEGLQMDEVAFPIMLAHHIQKTGIKTLGIKELEMVRKAAEFISKVGPATQQDRWEEIGGYIPSTIAVQIAALETATELLGNTVFAQTAAQWRNNIDRWTLVQSSPIGKNYYLRTSPSGNPGNFDQYWIANGGPQVFAWQILDGGFLEMVKYGIKDAQDPAIKSTLQIYENSNLGIRDGQDYRRYNFDGYGPNSKGGYWPLLAAERGLYAVAAQDLPKAMEQSRAVLASATSAGLLPEQIETSAVAGKSAAVIGKGGACPLVWSHANYILLERSIQDGRVFESP